MSSANLHQIRSAILSKMYSRRPNLKKLCYMPPFHEYIYKYISVVSRSPKLSQFYAIAGCDWPADLARLQESLWLVSPDGLAANMAGVGDAGWSIWSRRSMGRIKPVGIDVVSRCFIENCFQGHMGYLGDGLTLFHWYFSMDIIYFDGWPMLYMYTLLLLHFNYCFLGKQN